MNSADVVNASGLTYRQLDHAARKEWLKPHQSAENKSGNGSGFEREWSYQEYQIAIVASRLMRAGLKTQRAFELARIRMNMHELPPDIYLGHGITLTIELPK